MIGGFDRALPRVLVYEGGRVNNPRDPGGKTNKGITQSTYAAWLRSQGRVWGDVYDTTPTEVSAIYRKLYWDIVRGDDLPAGLDFAVFDGGVNSGNSRSVMWLQAALGDVYKGQIDGQLGDKTLQAIADFNDVDTLIENYCSRRLGTLKRLNTWKDFGVGWSARVANVQKTAISWNDTKTVQPVDVTALGGHMKAPVNDNTIKQPPVQQMTAHLATAGGSVVTVATQAGQQIAPLADTFGWVKYVAGGLTLAAIVGGVVVKTIADANDAAQKSTAKAFVDLDADSKGMTVQVEPPPPTQKAA